VKSGKNSKREVRDEEAAPLIPSADVEISGPEVGSLYLIDNGARVHVTGRAGKFFDTADAIEVTVERTGGTIVEEHGHLRP
jgi:hypothetical protein